MQDDAGGRARSRVRLVVLVLVPVGLALSLVASAFDAHQQRDRAEQATRADLAVSAEALTARLGGQLRVASTSASLLTPTTGASWDDAAAAWESHLRVLAGAPAFEAGPAAVPRTGPVLTSGVGWLPAPASPADRAGALDVRPAGGAAVPGDVHVTRVVRLGSSSLLDALAAGADDAAGAAAVADALAAARDSGQPVLSAAYPTPTVPVDPSDAGKVARAGVGTPAEAAIAAPVYDSADAPGSTGERRRRLLGWTVTTFAVAPLLDAVSARPRDAALVTDGGTAAPGGGP